MPYTIISPQIGTWEEIRYKQQPLRVCRMVLRDTEFDSCIKTAPILDSKTWNESTYREGLLNNKNGADFNTEEVGVLCERATCKLFGFIQDENYKKGGDEGFDFKVNGHTYNVKGASKFWGKNYIKATHEKTGNPCELKSELYFLSYINKELTKRDDRIVVIDIVGLIAREHILEIQMKRTPRKDSTHQNFEVTYDNPNIKPITDIYNGFLKIQEKKGLIQQVGKNNFALLRLKVFPS